MLRHSDPSRAAFTGWIGHRGAHAGPAPRNGLSAPEEGAHAPRVWAHGQLSPAAAGCPALPWHPLAASTPSADHRVLAFWGRLDNRPSLLRALDAPADLSVPDLLLIAWRRFGEAMFTHLEGDWAMLLHDDSTQTTLLARDPVGTKPLCWAEEDGRLLFGPNPSTVRAWQLRPATPDPDMIVAGLASLMPDTHQTAWLGIHRLPPGHWLRMQQGRIEVRRWHWFGPEDHIGPRAAAVVAGSSGPGDGTDWVEAYREQLIRSVRDRMPSQGMMGVEVTGGVDSSSILAVLAKHCGSPPLRLLSLSMANLPEEAPSALMLSKQFGLFHHYVNTNAAPEESGHDSGPVLRALGQPDFHGMAQFTSSFHDECGRHGAVTIFSGFGGDECASSQVKTAHRQLVDAGQMDALARLLPGNSVTRRLRAWRTLRSGAPCGAELPAARLQLRRRLDALWLRPGLVDDETLMQRLIRQNVPRMHHRDINAAAVDMLRQPYVSARLEACTLAALRHDLDMSWPLLDRRLIEQVLATPVSERAGPGYVGRYLHRRAIAPWIPTSVAWRATKDMGVDQYMRQMMRQHVLSAAASGKTELDRLHPLLASMLDTVAMSAATERAIQGQMSAEDGAAFKQGVRQVKELNQWLWLDLPR